MHPIEPDGSRRIARLQRLLKRDRERATALLTELAACHRALNDARLLVREVDHRAKNSLQLAAAMLQLQARRSGDETVRTQLGSAERRLQNLAGIHAALYAGEDAESLSVRQWLERVVFAFEIPETIAVSVEAPDVDWPAPLVRTLGLFASEAIANCLKYAFDASRTGRLLVRIGPAAEGYWGIEIADDGVGSPDTMLEGLGCQLLRTFGRQLGGEVRFTHGVNGRGLAAALVFPLEPQQTRAFL